MCLHDRVENPLASLRVTKAEGQKMTTGTEGCLRGKNFSLYEKTVKERISGNVIPQ